jgi:hypothetical protein
MDLDKLTKKCSAFDYFTDLINAKGNYWPSLKCRPAHKHADEIALADAYDREQVRLGDSRRTYRY